MAFGNVLVKIWCFSLSCELARPRDESVVRHHELEFLMVSYHTTKFGSHSQCVSGVMFLIFSHEIRRERLKVSHHPAKLGDHWHSGDRDIMILVCEVISGDHTTKGSCELIARSPWMQVTILPSLMVIDTVTWSRKTTWLNGHVTLWVKALHGKLLLCHRQRGSGDISKSGWKARFYIFLLKSPITPITVYL